MYTLVDRASSRYLPLFSLPPPFSSGATNKSCSTKSYKLLKKTRQVWKGKYAQTQPRMNLVAA